MTVGELSDAVEACRISLDSFKDEKALVNVGGSDAVDELLRELPGMAQAQIYHIPLPELPGLEQDGSYGEVAMEKNDWKLRNRDYVKQILQYRPEVFMSRGMYFRHIRWCICSGKSMCGACHGGARRGEDSRADSVRFLDGTCSRQAKSAMILMQCGICFQEFLLLWSLIWCTMEIPRIRRFCPRWRSQPTGEAPNTHRKIPWHGH